MSPSVVLLVGPCAIHQRRGGRRVSGGSASGTAVPRTGTTGWLPDAVRDKASRGAGSIVDLLRGLLDGLLRRALPRRLRDGRGFDRRVLAAILGNEVVDRLVRDREVIFEVRRFGKVFRLARERRLGRLRARGLGAWRCLVAPSLAEGL